MTSTKNKESEHNEMVDVNIDLFRVVLPQSSLITETQKLVLLKASVKQFPHFVVPTLNLLS